jgi:hypothetical protein
VTVRSMGLWLSSARSTVTRALPSFARCLGSRSRFASARTASDEGRVTVAAPQVLRSRLKFTNSQNHMIAITLIGHKKEPARTALCPLVLASLAP